MKVLVLAIDGLEYKLVKKWNISTYMQKKYGKHDISVALKPGDPISTPLL